MKHIDRPFEFTKEVSAEGAFEGLASVYGNVDLGGDIVEPGAFKEFVLTKDGMIRLLDGHNTRVPIGKGRLTDTHVGLAISGQLNLKLPAARIVHELMKDGITDGLSIGFDTLPGGDRIDDNGIRHLEKLKLWEVSTTVFPMNPAAKISAVKSIPKFSTIREAERWVRDELDLSADAAKEFVARFKQSLAGARDEPTTRDESSEGDEVKEAASLLKFLSSI
jgi:HK97 family phage prohead protease